MNEDNDPLKVTIYHEEELKILALRQRISEAACFSLAFPDTPALVMRSCTGGCCGRKNFKQASSEDW